MECAVNDVDSKSLFSKMKTNLTEFETDFGHTLFAANASLNVINFHYPLRMKINNREGFEILEKLNFLEEIMYKLY